jgi:non-heme chloroperoxidase
MAIPFRPNKVDVDGAELTYIEQGQGAPLVFVHGSVNDFRSWANQIEPLSQHYRVIAYSRRYHYPNAEPDQRSEYSTDRHRDDLAALIKALGLAPTHLVASSYGAYVCLLLAAARPDLVRSLVLGEPPAFPLLGPTGIDSIMSQAILPSRRAFESGDREQGIRTFIDAVVGEGAFDRFPPPARSMALDNASEFKLEVNTPVEKYFSAFTCEDAGRIGAPTLLLTGELSPRFFYQITDQLDRCMPNTKRATIPQASHGMHNMNPRAYSDVVLSFLARH